jgi:hypothetical protein
MAFEIHPENRSEEDLMNILKCFIVHHRYRISTDCSVEGGRAFKMTEELQQRLSAAGSFELPESKFPDLDITASCVIVRAILGNPAVPSEFYERFDDRFQELLRTDYQDKKAYPMKCYDTTFPTKCLLLQAFQHLENQEMYAPQLNQLVKSLCEVWLSSTIGWVLWDPGNQLYFTRVFSESFITLLHSWNEGGLHYLDDEFMREKVPLALLQLLQRLLCSERFAGWGHWRREPYGREEPYATEENHAFGILTLANLSSLPFLGQLSERVKEAILRLRTRFPSKKVTANENELGLQDATAALTYTYTQAALYGHFKENTDLKTNRFSVIQKEAVQKFMARFSGLARKYHDNDDNELFNSVLVLEGFLLLPLLKRRRINVITQDSADMDEHSLCADEDEHSLSIAILFSIANTMDGQHNTDTILALITVELRAYQIDEYLKRVMKVFFLGTGEVKDLIYSIFGESYNVRSLTCPVNDSEDSDNDTGNARKRQRLSELGDGISSNIPSHTSGLRAKLQAFVNGILRYPSAGTSSNLSDLQAMLQAFANGILRHPSVLASSQYRQNLLKAQLRDYVLAQVILVEESERFKRLETTPLGSYHGWIRTTATRHILIPLLFTYLQCLNVDDTDTLYAHENYIIQEILVHMAKWLQMERDDATWKNNKESKKLISTDFPEFWVDDTIEGEFDSIIDFERARCELDMAGLKEHFEDDNKRTVEMLEFIHRRTEVEVEFCRKRRKNAYVESNRQSQRTDPMSANNGEQVK